jgi:CheY-like chemotaxis protein
VGVPSNPGPMMKLLIVDDNASFRRFLGDVVAPVTTEVYECVDGAQALGAYEHHHPDVVLMDIAMKGVDGISATAAIVTAHPEARVVVVTQHDGADLREAARAAGACGYVVKDRVLELQTLLERVRDQNPR